MLPFTGGVPASFSFSLQISSFVVMRTLWGFIVIILGLSLDTSQGKVPPCNAGLDVAIVLDKSESVTGPNLRKVINVLGHLIDKFHPAPGADHFGFITFHNKANLVFNFSNSKYHDRNVLLEKIANEPIKLGNATRTDLALIMARDELFSEEGGDRPDKPNVMIILTDGTPTKPKGQKIFDFKGIAKEISKDFKARHVNVVAVGIGPRVNQVILHWIAGNGPVVHVKTFSKLEKMTEKIKSAACSAIDGGYTDWKESSACTVTCGGGTQTLTRTCTSPPPSNGGKDCSGLGPATNEVSCNEQECPIDGGYTDWKESSACTVTCGGGTQTLTRTCTNPPPSNAGKDCSGLGPAEKIQECKTQDCPPPCTAGLDIAIVLDKSKSVRKRNLRKVITFLGKLIDKFHPAPDADHFGFITFHNKANLVFNFTNSEYHDKDTLLEKIANEPIKLELETRTDLALIMARDELFSEAGGDRPDKPNVMIILTDGKPTNPKDQKKFDFKDFAEGISKDFKAKHVNTVAVGIGRGVDQDTLELIAGDGPVVQVDDFSKLEEMMGTIKSSACSD